MFPKIPGVKRSPTHIWPLPPLQVRTRSTRDPAAAQPPPPQRAAESPARLPCILDRQGACAAAVRTRAERPAEALQNRFSPTRVSTRAHKQPQPTAAACLEKFMRPGGNREGDLHFAHAAIKKCLQSAHRKQQKYTHSQGQNPHLRSNGLDLRRRVAVTLQTGAQRRTGRIHIFIERAHVNFCRAACRGAGSR